MSSSLKPVFLFLSFFVIFSLCSCNLSEKKQSFSPTTQLFDGSDFSKWQHEDGKPVKWKIVGDAMQVVPASGSIVTKESYEDFKLHVEFKIPELPKDLKGQNRGNSGIYIQKRYEVQILDSYGKKVEKHQCGAIYDTFPPNVNSSKKPGKWQSYDITFYEPDFDKKGNKINNARITVVHNGAVIHDNVEIPNKTGAGRPEGPKPGPIKLQDHGSEVMFRNIWITSFNKL